MSEQQKPENAEEEKTEAAEAAKPETAAPESGAETEDEGVAEVGGVDRVAELEAEVATLNDKLLRAAAELQNVAKRADRDRREAETYGGRRLARDLLSVYDNLQAALSHASDELKENEADFFNGVDLTRKELLNAFAKHKVEPLEPDTGVRFDPNRHQAMFEAPVPGATPGTVIQVMQAGFTMADQLLRPAMVGVASAASGAAPEPAKEESGDDEKASAK